MTRATSLACQQDVNCAGVIFFAVALSLAGMLFCALERRYVDRHFVIVAVQNETQMQNEMWMQNEMQM
jgi:hypothetical protein